MASSSTQDLIVDGAELSHPITIKRGKTSRIYQVIAYPTQLTRKTTNGYLDGTITPDPKTIKKCRWHTAGIIRFHVNPETNLIYEARPDLHELEVTLECLLEESHKEQLATRAEEIYGLEFSADNFIICPFQTFMAQLAIRISSGMKTFYGTLVDNKELHPMRIIFNIENQDELSEIVSKLDRPRDHDIVLRYDYSLSGTSTARASLTISAEEVNKIDLEKQIFGKSKAESMVVSRSFMDKITASITTKLRVVEDIGVGGSSFGQDLIKQEIANAMSASGFQKFTMDDIKQMQSADTDITDDLKANIINSASASNANSLASSHRSLDQSSAADSSDILHEKSDADRTAGGQSTSSSESMGVTGNISIAGFGLGGGYNTSSSGSQATNFDNSNSSAKKDHEKISTESSSLNEKSGSDSSSNSNSNAVQGQIRQAKDIDATIVHRSEIAKGFTISLERWHHQLATTSIKGRLTTKTDVEMLEEVQAKENAEREKQARKEEEEKKAQKKAMDQECELTSQQIDDLLHTIDSLDEDKLKEMHAEFMELCPDGKMKREVFSNAFRDLYSGGKVSNYCRYAFNIFDQDNNGTLNFTEYVMAMHIHESDDLEHSLGLAFNVFDYDKSGVIDQKEILHMITATSELLGKSCEIQSAKSLAKKILDSCDKKRNGKITKEEFVNGCKNSKEYCQMLIPNFDQITTTHDPNYEGELEYGKKNGQGIYTWPDGRRYEGQWKDDKQYGKGVYTWPDGRQYEGEWKDDMKNGNGIETSTDGERYEGEWKNDKKNGKGVQVSPEDTRFEGDWKDDKKNGKGVYTWPDGRQYNGQWKDDKQEEKGLYIWPDGRQYEGDMKGELKDGNGIETLPDGKRYEGKWKDGKKNAKGIQTTPEGDQYDGYWEDDMRNGKGVQTTAKGDRYEGDWKNDSRDGQGVSIYKSGQRYEGQWKNNKLHGKGVYTWPSGRRYEGDLKDGLSDGNGVETLPDGEKYEGKWKNDKKNGKGVLTLPNGNRFEGEWKDDERNANGHLTCPNGMTWNGHINDELMKGTQGAMQSNQTQWTYTYYQ